MGAAPRTVPAPPRNLDPTAMTLFRNLRISAKLALAFLSIVLLMIVMAVISIHRLDRLNDQTNFMVTARMASVRDAGQMSEIANRVRLLEFRLATMPAAEAAAVRQSIAETSKAYEDIDKAYPASIGDATEQAIYDRVKARYPAWTASHAKVERLVQEERRAEAIELLNGEARETFLALKEPLTQLVKHNEDRAKAEAEESNQTFTTGFFLIASGTGVAILLAVLLSWSVARGIVIPLKEAVGLAEAVARGDLTRSLSASSKDEVGDLLRALAAMRDNLIKTLTGMRESSDSVATASAQIASGNVDLSSRTEKTAGSLQQTAASMEELTTTVKTASEAAQQANQLAQAASQVAVHGGEVISEVVETMRDIHESSQKIAAIIGTIDGIAFQTNILALNAAVEAARAGEQGRGFAVVASEVRNLAQRSAVAAKEIKTLIEASVDKVGSGTQLVNDAGATMGKIVESIQRVSHTVSEISAGAVEQAAGIDQINSVVTQLDQMTQENSALVEESAAAAESLKSQAVRLSSLVEFFQLGTGWRAERAETELSSRAAHGGERRAKEKSATAPARAQRISNGASAVPVLGNPKGGQRENDREWVTF